MQKSFITTVNAWRFERPLAIALAASAMFMVMAVPPARLSAFPGLTAFPAFQPVLALIVGLALGALGYVAMAYPWPHVAVAAPVADEAVEDEQGQLAAAEVSLRLRRADRHPDAPVREPIFASRDLGSPFMEVGAFAPPPAEDESEHETAEHPIPEGDYAEIEAEPAESEVGEHEQEHELEADHGEAEPAPVAQAVEPEPIAEAPVPVVEHEWPIPEMPAPIAAFAPEDEPVPQPLRAQRQSIAAMMDRLSAGLERRAANGDAPMPPQDRQPALRDALDELNRIAARRS